MPRHEDLVVGIEDKCEGFDMPPHVAVRMLGSDACDHTNVTHEHCLLSINLDQEIII